MVHDCCLAFALRFQTTTGVDDSAEGDDNISTTTNFVETKQSLSIGGFFFLFFFFGYVIITVNDLLANSSHVVRKGIRSGHQTGSVSKLRMCKIDGR